MKKYILLIIGIMEIIISFIWMTLSQSSTGLYLFLASMGGVTIKKGIDKIKSK